MIAIANQTPPILAQSQQPFLTYNNTRFGFTIQYPSDWKYEEEIMLHSVINYHNNVNFQPKDPSIIAGVIPIYP